ncbi:MAG: hypothetical protein CMD65_04975 [Gammaproteobacteria bacterium]|nr:hypothetical protein [Gammaproteobacteria bacterium]
MKKKLISEYNKETGTVFSVEYLKKLAQVRSKFQLIEVYQTKKFGKVLLIDKCFMLTEKDYKYYHEGCIDILRNKINKKTNILIIGGGDFALVKSLSRFDKISSITLVEIDAKVIDICKKFFPQFFKLQSKFKQKLNIVIDDGYNWVKKNKTKFDISIIDCTDPNHIASKLYSYNFYKYIFQNTKKNGLIIQQAGNPIIHTKNIIQPMCKKLEKVGFIKPQLFSFPMPTYPLGTWSFIKSCKNN